MQHFAFPHSMRRFAAGFSIVSLALLIMASFSACGGSSTGTSGTSTGPVNLTYWSWIPGMDKQVALFNQTHPIFMSPGAM